MKRVCSLLLSTAARDSRRSQLNASMGAFLECDNRRLPTTTFTCWVSQTSGAPSGTSR
jgi:hypothetical protein